MLLDVSGWAPFSCHAVAGASAFYALLAVGVLALLSAIAKRSFSLKVTGWRARNIRLALKGFRIFPIILLLAFGVLLLNIHHRRELFTEGTNLVETGCYRLSDYRYELPLENLLGRYEATNFKGWHDEVVFTSGKESQELSVELKGSPYFDNIRKLAPIAVDEYLREVKKRD